MLVADVDDVGRSGDLVEVKPGFARNYIVPQGKGVVADKFTLKMQKQLQEERAKRAAVDRASSEQLASQINGLSLETTVKVDPEGHMYGSVKAADIVEILAGAGVEIEKRFVRLHQPIRKTGEHEVPLRLKEEVTCSFKLTVHPDVEIPVAPIIEEAPPEPILEEEPDVEA